MVLHFFEHLVGVFFSETKVSYVEFAEPPDFAAALEVLGHVGTGSSWAFHHR